jgi:hypothetical protein
LGIGIAAAFAAACQLIAGIEIRQAFEPQEAEAAPPPEAAPPDVSDPCPHASWPPPPITDDDPSGAIGVHDPYDPQNGTLIVVLAVQSLAFETVDDAGHPRGFDLDSVCTCDNVPNTRDDGGAPCKTPGLRGPVCDDEGGVDNAAARLLAGYGQSLAGPSISKPLRCGSAGIILQIIGYNGRANDGELRVGGLASAGMHTRYDAAVDPAEVDECCGQGIDGGDCFGNGEGGVPARWDGNDSWDIVPNPARLAQSAAGYVNNWTLVVRDVPSIFIPLGAGSLQVKQPIIVARLIPLGPDGSELPPDVDAAATSVRIDDGTLAARASLQTLAEGLGNFRFGGSYLCQPGIFTTLEHTLCESTDLMFDPTADFSPGAVCDALSVGLGFSAKPALLGVSVDGGFLAGVCEASITGCSDAN